MEFTGIMQGFVPTLTAWVADFGPQAVTVIGAAVGIGLGVLGVKKLYRIFKGLA